MRKSSVVKVLEVEYDSDELQSLEIMAGMLPNMLNLCKLRISVEDIRRSGVSGGINQAIRGGYFRLRILCLEESQCHWEDIKGIVASQPDMRLFGFHRRHKIFKPLLTTAQKLYHDPSRLHPMPTIFMLDFDANPPHTALELLPSDHQPGETPEVSREIETCFNSRNHYMYSLKLDLFGISGKGIDLFREVMAAVAFFQPTSFRGTKIIVHQTSIQTLWRFPEFVKPLAPFPHLETLTFKFRYVLGATDFHKLSTDLRLYLPNSDLGTVSYATTHHF